MSFSLYSLLEARKFSHLPQLLQEIITEDLDRRDMFQEKFLDYDEKDRWIAIRSAMDTCLGKGMFQERAFYHVLFLQEIRGEEVDEEWEEMIEENCEENDTFKVEFGTQTEPIAIQTEEPQQEVVVPMCNDSEPPTKTYLRGRKYGTASDKYRCWCCRMNLASDGSLHNHYKSKLHIKGLRKWATVMRSKVLLEDKVIVRVRNALNDPDLSWEMEAEEDIDFAFNNIETYLERNQADNPITDIFLRRKTKQGSGSIVWKAVML